jgi:hypothetical protein
VYINKIFTNTDYKIQFQGNIWNQIGLYKTTPADLSLNTYYNLTGPSESFNAYFEQSVTINKDDQIIVTPLIQHTEPSHGLGLYPMSFVINLLAGNNLLENDTYTTSSTQDLADFITKAIAKFTDPELKNPFISGIIPSGASKLPGNNPNPSINITICLNKILTHTDYTVSFVSNQLVGPSLDQTTWDYYLGFDSEYDMSVTPNPIENNTTTNQNEITLIDNSNNFFYIQPFSDIDGLITPRNTYTIKVTIPAGGYTIENLYAEINLFFNNCFIGFSTLFSSFTPFLVSLSSFEMANL